MEWHDAKKEKPQDSVPVVLKVRRTSVAGIIDETFDAPAIYKNGEWIVEGEPLKENDYPIFNEPIQWKE